MEWNNIFGITFLLILAVFLGLVSMYSIKQMSAEPAPIIFQINGVNTSKDEFKNTTYVNFDNDFFLECMKQCEVMHSGYQSNKYRCVQYVCMEMVE